MTQKFDFLIREWHGELHFSKDYGIAKRLSMTFGEEKKRIHLPEQYDQFTIDELKDLFYVGEFAQYEGKDAA